MKLQNRIALITGGKRIGAYVASALAQRGVDVALSYARSQSEAERTADAVRGAGRRAAAIHADLSQPDQCEALVTATAETFGGATMSCFICGKHRPRSLLKTRKLLGKAQQVCSPSCKALDESNG